MENNVLLNNGMATNNPQANVNSVQNNTGVPQQNNQGGQINPITIPIQIQPQVGQVQQPTTTQPNNNLQVNQQQPQYNAPTPQQYQNNNQNSNVVDFNQIYKSYQNAYGNTYNSDPTASTSGIKKTSIGTTIVTPTTSNLNSVQGQYQSAYSDTINGIISQMLSSVNSGFQYDPTTDNSLKVATEYASNTTLQSLAGSGVLNSSATSERVARIVADLIPQYEEKAHNRWMEYLGQLSDTAQLVMNFDSQQFSYWADAKDREFQEKEFEFNKKQKELENAWKRVDELGFTDNEASAVLGVKVGTLSAKAREAKEEREFELNKMREQFELERENDIAITKLKSELELNNSRTMARYNANLEKEIYGYKSELDTLQSKELSDYQANIDKSLYKYKSNIDTQQSKTLADYQANIDKDIYSYKSNIDTAQSKELSDYQLNNDKSLYKYRTNLDTAQSIQLAENQLRNDKELYGYKSNIDTSKSKELADYQANIDKNLYSYKSNVDTKQSKEVANYNNKLSNSSKEYEYKLAQQYGTTSSKDSNNSSKLATYEDIIKNRFAGYDEMTRQYTIADEITYDEFGKTLDAWLDSGAITEEEAYYLATKYGKSPMVTTTTNKEAGLTDNNLQTWINAVDGGNKELESLGVKISGGKIGRFNDGDIKKAVKEALTRIKKGTYTFTTNQQLMNDIVNGEFGKLGFGF